MVSLLNLQCTCKCVHVYIHFGVVASLVLTVTLYTMPLARHSSLRRHWSGLRQLQHLHCKSVIAHVSCPVDPGIVVLNDGTHVGHTTVADFDHAPVEYPVCM